MDADVVRLLTNVAAAVRLMGAECILTGVGANIARTLVREGIELGGLEVRRTLADGLGLALGRTDARRPDARAAADGGRES
jgi:rsbT co-antagonist protein RsbR